MCLPHGFSAGQFVCVGSGSPTPAEAGLSRLHPTEGKISRGPRASSGPRSEEGEAFHRIRPFQFEKALLGGDAARS